MRLFLLLTLLGHSAFASIYHSIDLEALRPKSDWDFLAQRHTLSYRTFSEKVSDLREQVYTAGQLAGLGYGVLGAIQCTMSASPTNSSDLSSSVEGQSDCGNESKSKMLNGGLAFILFKAWEIYDASYTSNNSEIRPEELYAYHSPRVIFDIITPDTNTVGFGVTLGY